MSVHVLSWVLKHSEETLGRRLVLLVLADHAKEDGTCSWPAVETIATEARLSERQVQYALRGLEDAGSITCTGRTKKGTRVYSVNMGGANIAPFGGDTTARGGAIYDTEGVQPIAPEPSLEPSYVEANASTRPPDPIWDALVAELGEPVTKNERKRRNVAVSQLKEIETDADEVRRRCRAYRRMWPRITLTDMALVSNWSTLDQRPPAADVRRSVEEVIDLPDLSDDERQANLERVRAFAESIGKPA